ncbi:leucine-rich repeat-containing protein 40 isoform X2 [Anabrus simplex]|uniref:leucine-rich repeat-containing protein 40 isoform X2 n=1 Tax=Anabrus simplex TaxID=316456 RepID=UPI0035A2E883
MNKRPRSVGSRFQRINPVFHLQSQDADSKELSAHLIKLARKSGQLNLSGRGLGTVPEKVWKLDELDESEVRLLEVRLDSDGDCNRWWEHEALTLLDLSSNSLTRISPNVKNLHSLTTLHLQDNGLDTLPDELGLLSKLTRLNISHNKICSLPPAIYNLLELRVLLVSHNQLEAVGEGICDLVMLNHLDLSHNCVASLPSGIGYLIRLTQLDLSHNNLLEIPPDLVNLRVLLDLNLSHNKLTSLPPMGELRRLELLYLEHNLLTAVPDLTGCEALRELHLADNCIKEMAPESIEGLIRLRVLNLRENKLLDLPVEVSNLRRLVRLDLTNNSLTSLPPALGLLPHLQNLQLEGNPLRTVRGDMLRCGTPRLLCFLRQKLQAEEEEGGSQQAEHGGGLISDASFPDRYMMRNDRSLSLALKDLHDVPVEVFKDAVVAEVTVVDLSKNKLTQVPTGLQELTGQLSELNLSCNLLKSIPASLGGFSKLQYLDLQKNALSSLPEEMAELQQLRELIIAYNRFLKMPSCIFEMAGLEILSARDNQMEDIPVDGLKNLRRLAVLDLSNNSISHVPPELGTMLQLRSLELSGNCFRQPRYSVLEKGTAEVLSYLRDRIPQQQ